MDEGTETVVESSDFSLSHARKITHYYGNSVRGFFLAAAIVTTISIPVFGGLLPFGSIIEISWILAIVLLAALTSPHGKLVFIYNTVVAGISVVLVESSAVSLYSSHSLGLFVVREVVALFLLLAFYYSIKTLRAMSLGIIGKVEPPWEFEEEEKEEQTFIG